MARPRPCQTCGKRTGDVIHIFGNPVPVCKKCQKKLFGSTK